MRRITDVRLPAPLGSTVDQRHCLELDGDGVVVAIEAMADADRDRGEGWAGDWISPRGIDLQINGGLGLAFPELTPSDLPRLGELLEQLWADGVEAIAPTLVTCGIAPLRQALTVLRQARMQHQPGRCRLLGAHLEGPFLAEARRGAHPIEHLANPSLAALNQRIDGFESDIALVTLAPELEGAAAVIRGCGARITVALGHSSATADQAATGFDQGVGMLTHAFNAMPGLHHRAPGPLGKPAAAGTSPGPDRRWGARASDDGGAAAAAGTKANGAGEDALAPYGLADGEHRWDERVLLVQNGTCRLEDGTLAGVTLPQLEGVKRLATWSGDAGAAIWGATMAPRRVIGTAETLEDALVGQPLMHLLRWGKREAELQWTRAA